MPAAISEFDPFGRRLAATRATHPPSEASLLADEGCGDVSKYGRWNPTEQSSGLSQGPGILIIINLVGRLGEEIDESVGSRFFVGPEAGLATAALGQSGHPDGRVASQWSG